MTDSHETRFGLMRHGKTEFDLERRGIRITPNCSAQCQKNVIKMIDELKRIEGSKPGLVMIYSSPKERAILTGNIVREVFAEIGVKAVGPIGVDWLDVMRAYLTHQTVRDFIREHRIQAFVLMVTHLNIIQNFLSADGSRISLAEEEIQNGTIWTPQFHIK